ncbi:MAG TPA: molybdopterin-dependent oxidoreductase [Acidimicrobiales bacterium]|nr:molybdopterin-dependent oxidoreductase [Acidimicrobiales bacterium]
MTQEPWRARTAGLIAAGAALLVSAAVDALYVPVPSLVLTVGQAVIRLTPGSLARRGVETFGTSDKPGLVLGVIVVSLAAGMAVGLLAARRRVTGPIAFAVFGAIGIAAASVVPGVSVAGAALAAAAAAGSGALVLAGLLALAYPTPPSTPVIGAATSRRRFLLATAAVPVGIGAVAVAGRRLSGSSRAAAQRLAVRLPRPATTAPRAAPGITDVPGLSRLVTPNADFYRIDEALVVPRVDLPSWRLGVTGMVDRPFELTYDQLLALPLEEHDVTLSCVSNEVGGNLVGTARWTGYPLAALLQRAGVDPKATQVVGRSVDGFTAGFPTEAALDGRHALVAVAMNGEPLPTRHGFPARLVVPGLYGYVSAVKWLRDIQLATLDFDPYWVVRGWARNGPIKTQSRIDVPRSDARVPAGRTAVAGVAWAPTRDIARVEVRVDDGPWHAARLGDTLGPDAWRQWVYEWQARPGTHRLAVRATDGTGVTQTADRAEPFPDGATGHHTITVKVS